MKGCNAKIALMTLPRSFLSHRLLTLALLASASTATADTTKIAVMPITFQRVNEDVTTVLNELLLSEVDRVSSYVIIGASDINAMLGLDRMKAALGCDDVSCAAEIGGALGVDYLLAVNVGVLGEDLILSGKLINIDENQVAQRASEQISNDERFLLSGLRSLVGALLGDEEVGPRAPTAAVKEEELPAPEKRAFIELGAGYVHGNTESGAEVETSYRRMLGETFGLSGGLLLGVAEGARVGIRVGLHVQINERLGLEVDFRGLPTHIDAFGGPSVGVHVGSLYGRAGVNILGEAVFNANVGYSFPL